MSPSKKKKKTAKIHLLDSITTYSNFIQYHYQLSVLHCRNKTHFFSYNMAAVLNLKLTDFVAKQKLSRDRISHEDVARW